MRRHGVYVWGASWEAAKTQACGFGRGRLLQGAQRDLYVTPQAECYHYLFEAAVRMRGIGVDPSLIPARVTSGIGAAKSYDAQRDAAALATSAVHVSDACCGPRADASGFAGLQGVLASNAVFSHTTPGSLDATACQTAPSYADVDAVLLDIEG